MLTRSSATVRQREIHQLLLAPHDHWGECDSKFCIETDGPLWNDPQKPSRAHCRLCWETRLSATVAFLAGLGGSYSS